MAVPLASGSSAKGASAVPDEPRGDGIVVVVDEGVVAVVLNVGVTYVTTVGGDGGHQGDEEDEGESGHLGRGDA